MSKEKEGDELWETYFYHTFHWCNIGFSCPERRISWQGKRITGSRSVAGDCGRPTFLVYGFGKICYPINESKKCDVAQLRWKIRDWCGWAGLALETVDWSLVVVYVLWEVWFAWLVSINSQSDRKRIRQFGHNYVASTLQDSGVARWSPKLGMEKRKREDAGSDGHALAMRKGTKPCDRSRTQ